MRRRPRTGDLLLACAIVVLAASAVTRLSTAAHDRGLGLAAFARDAARRPGVVSDANYRRAYRVVAVCAVHRPAAGLLPDYKLCGVLIKRKGVVLVRRWYHCKLGTRCAPPVRLQPQKAA